MKKLFLILLFTFFPINVLASNGDNSVDIRYKWYQEKVIDEVYYPKGMILDGYMEDITNIKYGLYSEWKEEYCDYSEDYYNKEYKDIIYYDSIVKTRYIKIEPTRYYQCEDGSCFDEIRVYNEMNLVNYNIIQVNEMGIILELEQEYDTSKLWFYIDTHSRYSLYLSYDKELTQMSLGHYITSYIDGKIVIPDDTWVLSYAKYVPMETNNIENGLCENCEEGYYLNTGDKKCSKTENCSESIYGNCISCYIGYYLNKKNNTCLLKVGNFLYCKQSLNDENCEICDEMSYLDENGICSLSNYCSKSSNGICQKCISNYYLSTFNNICSNEKNCNEADRDTGLCIICKSDYFLDTNDYKCKSNIENNEFKYCQKVVNNLCTECIKSYILSKDSKCVDTYNCLESENGKCILCEKNYHLGLDNKCTDIEHCIYTNEHGFCIECEDNYYYNTLGKNCTYDIDKFKNCKTSAGFYCSECKNNYYLNLNDSTCQDNTQKGPFYKCALSDKEEEICIKCIEGYYLGTEDKKCSLIENCKISKDENTCIECDESLCLDLKKNICVENDYIEDENKKFYFACKRTNIEGTKCELCIEGYEVGKDGYCVDNSRCLEEKDGKCLKCTEEENENGYSYCANEVFGCVESIWEGCLRCDDLLDIFSCTKCKEGYVDALSGGCNPIE